MSLNWKEIDLILEELQLPGAHLQEITQPDFHTLVLDLYRPRESFRLLISLKQQETRLHRTLRKPRKPRTIQRFVEFLRARVRGGRIIAATQVGTERIVALDILRGGETTKMWIRLWGGAANVIVTDDSGIILDAFFRRPKRGETTGEVFRGAEEAAKARDGGTTAGRRDPESFEVRDLPGEGDFNSRVEQFYSRRQLADEESSLRRQLDRAYDDRESRIRTTLARLRDRLASYETPERYRICGDLITANLYALHRGDRWLRTENYFEDNKPIEIELDPTREPAANAEAYYEKYKKAKAGLEIVREEVEQLERELESTRKEREAARAQEEMGALRDLAEQNARRLRSERKSGGARSDETPPGLSFDSNGYRIFVGRTARENDELLRHYARGNDTWLHARDYPGAYVFVKHIPGKSIPLDTLLDAGNLAVFYSKARSSGQAELYYTQVKYLRRPREGKRGLVLPTQEKNLSIRIDEARLERLQHGA